MTALMLTVALTLQSPSGRASDKAALLMQATAAITAGRRDEAKQLLRTAADRFQSVQALLQLARLQSGEGDVQAASRRSGRRARSRQTPKRSSSPSRRCRSLRACRCRLS